MRKWLIFPSVFLVLLVGCEKVEPPPPPPFNTTLTLPQLMDWVLDPAADGIWDSVGWVSTSKGEKAITPHTDAEWESVRNSAATLMEASNLLMLSGRAKDNGEWMAHSKRLGKAAQKALLAAQAKDVNGVFIAGSEIDAACEACHIQYAKFEEKSSQMKQ